MMSAVQKNNPEVKQGLLARPLDALIFLIPLLGFYEVISITRANPNRVIAFDLLKGFFELFGNVGMWAPGLGVVVILLATHVASGEPWNIQWRRVGLMYFEAAALAIPLLLLNWAIPLPLAGEAVQVAESLLDQIAVGIGAGIYEELVFRLIMISIMVMVGVDVFRLNRRSVTIAAVLFSSLAFAAHHHQPIGREVFEFMPFLFRTVAGTYLAIIFWHRGYGPAAGCHAAYNVALAFLGPNTLDPS